MRIIQAAAVNDYFEDGFSCWSRKPVAMPITAEVRDEALEAGQARACATGQTRSLEISRFSCFVWISAFSPAAQSWPGYFILWVGGGAYTHSDSWRELDDKIVTASANSWLASTKTENKERTLKRNFGVLGIAVICLSAKTRMRRLVPLFVRLVKGSWLA